MTIALSVLLLPGAAPATPAKLEKICREVEVQTGSHMRGGRTCKTVEQWAKEEEAKQRYLPVDARIRHNEEDVARDLSRPH